MQRRSGLVALDACLTHMQGIVSSVCHAGEDVKGRKPFQESELVDLLDALQAQAFEVGKIAESMKATLGVVTPAPDDD